MYLGEAALSRFRLIWLVWLCVGWLLLSTPSSATAAEAAGSGRLPQVGEWLEYVVAFPLDPLEVEIRKTGTVRLPGEPERRPPTPAPSAGTSSLPPMPGSSVAPPLFTPPLTWKQVPLRLEITQVTETEILANLITTWTRQAVSIPRQKKDPETTSKTGEEPLVQGERQLDPESLATLFGDAPQPGEQSFILEKDQTGHWLGDMMLSVEREVFTSEAGFVRLVNSDLPFGLARLATDTLDLVLVEHGRGIAPDFPLPGIHIDPPPGELYRP